MSEEKKNEAPEAPIEVSPATGELPDDAMSDASGGGIFGKGPDAVNPPKITL